MKNFSLLTAVFGHQALVASLTLLYTIRSYWQFPSVLVKLSEWNVIFVSVCFFPLILRVSHRMDTDKTFVKAP